MGQVLFGFVGTLITQALVACGVGSTTTESIRERFPAIQARQHDTKCRSLGFNPGTEGYKQCRLRLKIKDHTNRSCEPSSMSMNGPGCAFAISAYFHTHARFVASHPR